MNHIRRLQIDLAQAQATVDSYKAQIAQFSAFLCGPKFTGTENGERKDWISTTDVLFALREMQRQAEDAGEQLAANLRHIEFARKAQDSVLRTPSEWEQIDHVTILDCDSWRDGKGWGEPISRAEWEQRKATSTVTPS